MSLSIQGSETADLVPIVGPGHFEKAARPGGAHIISGAGFIGPGILLFLATIALVGPAISPSDPAAITGASLSAPSVSHIMGTDAIGRDLFSGVMYGARTSLLIAAAVGLVSTICGVTVGMIAGFYGSLADDLLMRGTELFQVLPRFFLVAVTIALFGPGVDRLVIVLGVTSWPVLARVVRAEVLTTRQLDYVLSSEALGASRFHLFRYVLLPQVTPAILVIIGLLMGQVLLIEASLGFIGLGDPNTLTWGILAGQAQGLFRIAWWLSVFPGLAIAMAVLGFNLTADMLSARLQRR